jgi:hypothetical protein
MSPLTVLVIATLSVFFGLRSSKMYEKGKKDGIRLANRESSKEKHALFLQGLEMSMQISMMAMRLNEMKPYMHIIDELNEEAKESVHSSLQDALNGKSRSSEYVSDEAVKARRETAKETLKKVHEQIHGTSASGFDV